MTVVTITVGFELDDHFLTLQGASHDTHKVPDSYSGQGDHVSEINVPQNPLGRKGAIQLTLS